MNNRKKAGIAWVILLIVLAGMTVYYGNAYRMHRNETRQQMMLALLQDEIKQFADERAPEQLRTIEELEQIEQELALRMAGLVATQSSAKRTPEADEDFKKWNGRLIAMRKARETVQNELEEAYLLYRQDLMPPEDRNAMYEEILEKKLEQGKAAALDVQAQYRSVVMEMRH